MEVFHDVKSLEGMDYCNDLKKAAANIGETLDQLVTDFVYSGRFKVQKPVLDDVDEWLYKIGV